jgi:Tfp pilus tip-associated adhesin PilY1
VTDPASLAYPVYRWEFPKEGDASQVAYLAETWGTPVVTRVKLRVGSNGNPDGNGVDQGFERWVVVVTAGYDVTGNPNHASFVPTGLKGRAIYILDAKTGVPIARRVVDAPTLGATEGYALASTPAVLDLDSDGFADVIYVGDLGGFMWKWVVSPIGEDRANDGSGLLTQPAWSFKKFFVAPRYKDGSVWRYKSFFFPPSATLYRGTLFLAFGTGERADLAFEGPTGTDADNNRFYVMKDLDPLEKLSPVLATLGETSLTNVSSNETCQSITTRGFFFVVANGEKFVTNTEIFARDVIAASYVPTDVLDKCETGGGESALYVFDVLCSEGYFDDGGNPTRKLELGGGFPTDPRISVGVDGKDNFVFIEKSRAEVESFRAEDLPGTGSLLYWREMP